MIAIVPVGVATVVACIAFALCDLVLETAEADPAVWALAARDVGADGTVCALAVCMGEPDAAADAPTVPMGCCLKSVVNHTIVLETQLVSGHHPVPEAVAGELDITEISAFTLDFLGGQR